jgi:hypothetical protein
MLVGVFAYVLSPGLISVNIPLWQLFIKTPLYAGDIKTLRQQTSTKQQGPKLDLLDMVQESENPSRLRAAKTVALLKVVSWQQNYRRTQDPQAGMYSSVGEENLDLLLLAMPDGWHHHNHILPAVEAVKTAENYPMLLSFAAYNYELAAWLSKSDHSPGARATYREIIDSGYGYRPASLLEPLLKSGDLQDQESALAYLRNGWNTNSTYQAFLQTGYKRLADENLPAAWDGEIANINTQIQFAKRMLELGNRPALDWAVWALTKEGGKQIYNHDKEHLLQDLRRALMRHAEVTDAKDIPAWFNRHYKRLQWDALISQFIII